MKKILLICLVCTFVFAIQGQKYGRGNSTHSDQLIEKITQAKINGDVATYQKLLEQYKSQLPEESTGWPQVTAVDDDILSKPAMRFGEDIMIYQGGVNVDAWAMISDLGDEAISVDYHRGDTLVAAVSTVPDGHVRLLKSIDGGMSWYQMYNWSIEPDSLEEPEVFYSPEGGYIHLFSRSTTGNGDIVCLTVTMPDSTWDQSWISGSDTVRAYSACTDRADWGDVDYWLYLTWHFGQGQTEDGVMFSRSFDNGATWTSADTILWNSAGYPDMVYGENSDLFVGFLGRIGGDYDIGFHMSTNLGSTWEPGNIIVVEGDATVRQPPQIASAYDGSGEGWLVWPTTNAASPNDDFGIRESHTTNSGSSWSGPTWAIDVEDSNEVLPSIAVYDGYQSTENIPWMTYTRWLYDYTGDGSVFISDWTGTDWEEVGTYNDTQIVYTRPVQTWEAPGVPAFAYVGYDAQDVWFDKWSNVAVEENEDASTPNELVINVRPNPFTHSTHIEYTLPTSGRVTAKVYNVLGQAVTTLFEGIQQSGKHALQWNATDLPKGIYFLKIETDNAEVTKKVILE